MISNKQKLQISTQLDEVISMMDIHPVGSKELYEFISPLLNKNCEKDDASLLVLWINEEEEKKLKTALRKCSKLLVNMNPRNFEKKQKAGVPFAPDPKKVFQSVRCLIRGNFQIKKIKMEPKSREFSVEVKMIYFGEEIPAAKSWPCRKWADFLGVKSPSSIRQTAAWRKFEPYRTQRDAEKDVVSARKKGLHFD